MLTERLLAASFAIVAVTGTARALDPREGMGAPVNTDVLQVLNVYDSGSTYWVNGAKTGNNAPFSATAEALRYGHLWQAGRNMAFFAGTVFPFYEDISVSGGPVGNQQLHVAGLNDSTAILAFWPLADWTNKRWFATAIWVTAPTGEYDGKRPLNVGRNVWTFRPEMAWVRGWGPFYLQLVTDLYFDTDNANYGPAARTLQRDALFGGEVHGSYNITKRFWAGLSWYYANGYQSRIMETGVHNNDGQNDQTLGLSVNYVLTKSFSILVSTKHKLATENGSDQTEILRLRLTYIH